MPYSIRYVCSECGKRTEVTTLKPQCECGGLWTLSYKPPLFDLSLADNSIWGMFRYRRFLPLIGDEWQAITLGEGMTPIIRFDENLLLKMDYLTPTLSFKDRGAAMLVSHCKAIGVKRVVQDSSGNAGNSVAAYCARAGIECEIFVPEGTSAMKLKLIQAHGAKLSVVPGSRDSCAEVCRKKAFDEGVYYANHVYNPFFYQGTKTYIYEVYEQLGRIPQNIFIPLGNGTLFIGIIKALEELLESGIIAKTPAIFAVQSEYCAPFIQAVSKGSNKVEGVEAKKTLAEGIAIGKPMRAKEILGYIYKYEAKVIPAPENSIKEAQQDLALKGIYVESTTAATLAAYKSYTGINGKLNDCLIPMCGAGTKSDK
ncbi:MAG: threonine synthase [Prevotellaceae bacterium]|jgi:threonine synthase|nr:threonine synthase [Prevotellaceae bacterium]